VSAQKQQQPNDRGSGDCDNHPDNFFSRHAIPVGRAYGEVTLPTNRFCWVAPASIIQLIDSIVAGNPCDEREWMI
jgi:hypothetical protein